jgi:acetyltransferase-like isoleucine patch superfamily enzyme
MIIQALRQVNRIFNYIAFKRDRLKLRNLVNRGLKIGKNVYIFEDVEIDSGYPYLIEIGDNCRIGKNVLILAHDATTFKDLGITRLAPVKILEGSFIGQRAIILPGVTIGPRAMVAAGSVVNRNVPEGRAVAGNPARPYTTYAEILDRVGSEATDDNVLDFAELEKGVLTAQAIREISERCGITFVRTVPSYDPFYVNTNMDEIRKNADHAYANFKIMSIGRKRK